MPMHSMSTSLDSEDIGAEARLSCQGLSFVGVSVSATKPCRGVYPDSGRHGRQDGQRTDGTGVALQSGAESVSAW